MKHPFRQISSRIKQLLSAFWFTSLILAAIPTLLIVLVFPVSPNKYVVNKLRSSHNRNCWYYDLESDSEKEMICLGPNPDSTLYLRIRNDNKELLGQFNLDDAKALSHNTLRPMAMDINADKVKELLIFTQKEDSLFLNTFDYTIPGESRKKRFITTIGGLNDKKDFQLNSLACFDATGDGIEEYYFSVAGGFALYPRRLFRYDFIEDSLISSINTGAAYLKGESVVAKGEFSLFVTSGATGNFPIDDMIPYSDSCSWFFIFDKDLEMKQKPLALGRYPSGHVSFKPHHESVFITWEEKDYRICEFSLNGDQIESRSLESSFPKGRVNAFNHKGDTLIYVDFQDLDSKLILQPEKYREKRSNFLSFLNGGTTGFQEDLDGDGLPTSFIFYNVKREGLIIINEDFRHLIRMEASHFYDIVDASFMPEIPSYRFLFNSKAGSEIFEVYKNPKYAMRYIYWLIIYLLSLAFVSGLFIFQQRRIQKQVSLEKQVADLQLQNLRNQLDPHFTFNALNTVGSAIYQDNRDDAYDLFQRFIRMIRSSLVNSKEVFQSLKTELQFTRDYLEFQKSRFRDRFDYSFEIDPEPDLEAVEIPKMLIQGFAENAVKHAFYGIDYKGQIRIIVIGKRKRIQIIISDNGIGIRRSRELDATTGTQKGLKNIREQIEQINKLYGIKIELHILDQEVDGIRTEGTVVKLLL